MGLQRLRDYPWGLDLNNQRGLNQRGLTPLLRGEFKCGIKNIRYRSLKASICKHGQNAAVTFASNVSRQACSSGSYFA